MLGGRIGGAVLVGTVVVLVVTVAAADRGSAVHARSSHTINPTTIPLGDGHVSSTPRRKYVDSCISFPPSQSQSLPWINSKKKTWNSETKPEVQGSVAWPEAQYSVTLSGTSRIIETNDLPVNHTTGIFPISPSDPAYAYDHNPNHIAAHPTTWTLPADPVAASTPSCTGLGPIGVLSDGILLFNALDAQGRDAAAHEVQDSCWGHPDGADEYHHHDVPSCILDPATGQSTLVGYAIDGYGIYVEKNKEGALLTDSNLDACHGRTSKVMWNGTMTRIYHYDATLEYPYTVGCFHGTPITH